METAGLIFIRIILSIIVGVIGSNRKIGFGWAFAASFLEFRTWQGHD